MSDRRETLTNYYNTWADGDAQAWVDTMLDLLEGQPCTK